MYSFAPHGSTGSAIPRLFEVRRTPHAVVVPSSSRLIGAARALYQEPTLAGRPPSSSSPRPEAIANPMTAASKPTAARTINRCATAGDTGLRGLDQLGERLPDEIVELDRKNAVGVRVLAQEHEERRPLLVA